MRNELLLIGSVLLIYGMVLIAYRIFGKSGLYSMMVLATVFANIEVLILVDGFGMEQTLGNVMFASTYLITDILSENEGRQSASRAVWLGVFASVIMLLFTQYWLLYNPAETDWASEHITPFSQPHRGCCLQALWATLHPSVLTSGSIIAGGISRPRKPETAHVSYGFATTAPH